MILYLDTSALLKLYIEEKGSDLVKRHVQSDPAFTQIIAYAELRTALAKALRMQRVDVSQYRQLLKEVEADWSRLHLIGVEQALVRRAGEMSEVYQLRGFDSLHLAAAEWLAGSAGHPVTFACFDDHLNQGASRIGLDLIS